MKKLSLLLVVLLAAGSAGLYGQMAIGTNFSVSGDATATVGYDIDDEQFGFKNEFNSDINIGLVWCAEEASMADENEDGMIGGKFGKCTVNNSDKVGMSGWVGTIELKDFRIVIDSGKFGDDDETHKFLTEGERYDDQNPHVAGDVTKVREQTKDRSGLYVAAPTIVAKLKNGPLWLQIFDKPAMAADLIGHIENDEDKDNVAESDDKNKDVGLDFTGPGITVGYTTTDLSFAVGVMSEVPYDSKETGEVKDVLSTKIVKEDEVHDAKVVKTGDVGSHAVSAELKVNVGPATLEAKLVQGLEARADGEAEDDDADDDTGIGVKLTTVFGDISLSAGADIRMTGEEDVETTSEKNEAMLWEAGGTASVTLTEHTSLKSTFIHSTGAAATDVEVVLSDKSGLVENLGLEVTWGLFDIIGGAEAQPGAAPSAENDKSDMFMQADLSYAIAVGGMDDMSDDAMMMKGPTLTPGTKLTINQLDGGDPAVGLEVRALLANAIPATTFGLKWASKQVVDTATSDALQGVITLWTKIAY